MSKDAGLDLYGRKLSMLPFRDRLTEAEFIQLLEAADLNLSNQEKCRFLTALNAIVTSTGWPLLRAITKEEQDELHHLKERLKEMSPALRQHGQLLAVAEYLQTCGEPNGSEFYTSLISRQYQVDALIEAIDNFVPVAGRAAEDAGKLQRAHRRSSKELDHLMTRLVPVYARNIESPFMKGAKQPWLKFVAAFFEIVGVDADQRTERALEDRWRRLPPRKALKVLVQLSDVKTD